MHQMTMSDVNRRKKSGASRSIRYRNNTISVIDLKTNNNSISVIDLKTNNNSINVNNWICEINLENKIVL